MNLLLLLPISIICGILSSTPPGPINLYIADQVLNSKKVPFLPLLSGIIIADVFYAFLAFFGYYTFFKDLTFGPILVAIGGLFLIFLGVSTLMKVNEKTEDEDRNVIDHPHQGVSFMKGLMLCGTNPGFLVFWLFIASQFKQYGLGEISLLSGLIILKGIAIGDLLWFQLFIRLLKKGADAVNSGVITLMRGGIAIILIGIGLYTIYNALL